MNRDLLLIAAEAARVRKRHGRVLPLLTALRRARHDQLRREVLPLRRRVLRAARNLLGV